MRQWVVWRFEHVKNQPKLTKVPYNPHTTRHASSTDRNTWSDFETCHAAVMANVGWDGVGFVLAADDPYCFVDLDPVRDEHGQQISAPHIEARQQEIFKALNSYSELSPSGAGLHIIVRATVPQGRKRDYVEVYSSGRFMTMTGHVYYPAFIEERQDEIDKLWHSLAKVDGINYEGNGDKPQVADDRQVYDWASQAANGAKFLDLWNGVWQSYYSSQSEADFALVDILAFYTHNRDQVKRLFRMSGLGQRDKAKREDYVDKMVKAAEDRRPPAIDFDSAERVKAMLLAEMEKPAPVPELVQEPGTIETHPLARNEWVKPPGLLGRIADFIYEASPRPVQQISLAASVAMLAGIVGRQWNVSGTGLNLYIMLIAPTGTGKEAISSGLDKLFGRVTGMIKGADEFIGPGDFASSQALIKTLSNKKSCVVVSGEFGLRMQQMASKHASSVDIGIKRLLLDLYNKSGKGQSIKPLVYSDREKNTELVHSPALTIIGETTPTTIYSALDETLIADGLLPRFLTTEYIGPRPPLNEAHATIEPPPELINDLAQLAHYTLAQAERNNVIDVQFTPEGKKVAGRFDKYADAQINNTDNDIYRQLWNRAHMKALKLAALCAVGINPAAPTVDEYSMQWACDIVNTEVLALLSKFDRGEIGREDNNEMAQVDYVRQKVAEYLKHPYDKFAAYKVTPAMHAAGVIEWSYLQRRCVPVSAFRNDRAGGTNALKRAVQALLDSDTIREVSKHVAQERYGTASRCFVVQDINKLR